MNKPSTFSENTGQNISKVSFLVVALVFFAIGFSYSQNSLDQQSNKHNVVKKLLTLNASLCKKNMRLPGFTCTQLNLLLKTGIFNQEESLRDQFSALPNLSAAIDSLQWNDGSENDAVRLLTIVRTLELGRQRQTSENYKAIPNIALLLKPVWDQYPELVTASACLYCGRHYNVLTKLGKSEVNDNQSLRQLSKGHPRFMSLLEPQKLFDTQEVFRMANIFAELGGTGDGASAAYVSSLVHKQGDLKLLKTWLQRGSTGGTTFFKENMDNLPLDIILAAWEQGVAEGYANIDLTKHLISHGHRPALRWVVWIEATDYKYIHRYDYERNQPKYQNMLKQFTNFPVTKGDKLAEFYSTNWKNINWDSESKQWRK